jgi:hypothetical protein
MVLTLTAPRPDVESELMALKTEFVVGGKTYVRNGGNGGVDVEIFGIRMTRWSGPDGESLTGEIRWVDKKPSLTVTEGDATLYRQLERLFWAANLDHATRAGMTDEQTGNVH